MTPEKDVAWSVPVCERCGWRGLPCRTAEEIAAEPTECPDCGQDVGAELRKGSWRAFSAGRIAGLRERRSGWLL
jgi:hypothetical protein